MNVLRIRREQQLSQEQLSLRTKLTRAYLSGIEAGTRNPTVDVLARLAAALDVGVEDLVKAP
ncbi:helix-turn-helix transcriptional regulator [Rhizobium calliandrae]|uniref:Helix-turn-helix transcriptional regulator n=1 Tax=Rhizobium calliandrae TaxID=1312182 RepID=A0ABT7KK92_9HYPH|nr:helix-turn-helix transcriptional regulator [Rhizobium calliandrae]MDL2408587.1 helix-turn-helix transcriptional regulator [Rhizobium calliandrae]